MRVKEARKSDQFYGYGSDTARLSADRIGSDKGPRVANANCNPDMPRAQGSCTCKCPHACPCSPCCTQLRVPYITLHTTVCPHATSQSLGPAEYNTTHHAKPAACTRMRGDSVDVVPATWVRTSIRTRTHNDRIWQAHPADIASQM